MLIKTFAVQIHAGMVIDVISPGNFIITDEIHFCFNGKVNTYNHWVWAIKIIQKQPFCPEKMTYLSLPWSLLIRENCSI